MKALLPLLLTLVLGVSDKALACDCDPAAVGRALSLSDIVFTGHVIGMRLVDPNDPGAEALTIVEFRVTRRWKGGKDAVATLHTQRSHSTCKGYEFQLGDTYLVFARKNTPDESHRYKIIGDQTITYGVDLCGGTTSFTNPRTRERERQLEQLLAGQRKEILPDISSSRHYNGAGWRLRSSATSRKSRRLLPAVGSDDSSTCGSATEAGVGVS